MRNVKNLCLLASMAIISITTSAQNDYNPIPSSVQMLNIAPEARGTSMGDAGVATSPDVNSQYWNPAKYAFMDSRSGVSLSVTPWLRKLVNDINLFYMAGYYRFDKRQTISASIRYFSLGDLIFTDEDGNTTGTYKPNEFCIDGAYSILYRTTSRALWLCATYTPTSVFSKTTMVIRLAMHSLPTSRSTTTSRSAWVLTTPLLWLVSTSLT